MSPLPIDDDNTVADLRLPNPRRLSTYDRTKEIGFHPFFRGGISRWLWRLYMFRVTRAGRWFIGLTLILILYGTSSIDLVIYIPLLYAFGIWVLAWLIAMFLPLKIKIDVDLPVRIAAGSLAPLAIRVSSRSRIPLFEISIVPTRLPPYIDCKPEAGFSLRELRWGQDQSGRLNLLCHKRGVYSIKGFRVETAFPLGLLNAYSNLWTQHQLLVYPKFTPLTHIDIPSGRRYQPGGVALASNLGDSLEYIGNRDYREGDNVRDIDWRATARLTRPIVREYREEYFHRVGVILDTFVPRRNVEREADFEQAVSICAAVSDYMSREEYVIDLFAAGPQLYHLTAGRSLAFQDQILDILACLDTVTTEPFEIIEPELLDNLAQLTTVICVFLDWNATRQAFVERIQQVSAVKLIVVRDSHTTEELSSLAHSLSAVTINRESFLSGASEL
jgi:uncharacterized protein (DUF58 family)